MLILFDLDDTLIETSKCLTPLYLKLAFDSMSQVGLDSSEESFTQLLALNKKAISSRFAIEQFLGTHSNKEEILAAGLEALKTPLPKNAVIELVPGALEVLDALKKQHDLALVTKGDSLLQLQKMEKAGIQPGQFSKLIVGSAPSKKFDYQRVLEELDVAPSEAIVCGDRVSVDLTPAKELGVYTVHFRNGRGLVHCEPKESVDLTIETLKELQEVFLET